jgi:DNA-binding CsgD family transcriptional regulator
MFYKRDKAVQPHAGEAITRAIYSGVLEKPPWKTLGRLCCEKMSSTRCYMVTYWQLRKEYADVNIHGKDEGTEALRQHYLAIEDVDPQRFLDMLPGRAYAREDLLTPDEISHGNFYGGFLQPSGMDHFLCLPVREVGGFRAWLSIGRKASFGPYSAEDKAFFEGLNFHLETALSLYSTLKRTQAERDIYRNLTGRLGIGLVVLDQAGQVIHSNDTATQIMQAGRISMLISGQQIRFQRRSLNEEFQRLIAAALTGEYGVMKVPAEGQMDVGLLIRPMPPAMEYTGESLPRILVYFSDPLAEKLVPPALIAKLFGLAPAEASLALQLADGLTLAAAAQKAGISESSARSYLKRIFAKIGINRQSELVALILKSMAVLALPDETRHL